MSIIDEVPAGSDARVYAEGWQSWSPTTWYHRGTPPHRPAEQWQHTMRFRPGRTLPDEGLQGEGLVVVEPGGGAPARVYGTLDASSGLSPSAMRKKPAHCSKALGPSLGTAVICLLLASNS